MVQIPGGWVIQPDSDGAALLFPPTDPTTSLRVSTIRAVGGEPHQKGAARTWLSTLKVNDIADLTPTAAKGVTRDSVVWESGVPVLIRFWYLVNASPPDTLDVAIVSLGQERATNFRTEYVDIVEAMIRTASFR